MRPVSSRQLYFWRKEMGKSGRGSPRGFLRSVLPSGPEDAMITGRHYPRSPISPRLTERRDAVRRPTDDGPHRPASIGPVACDGRSVPRTGVSTVLLPASRPPVPIAALHAAGPDPLSAASMYAAGPHALSAASMYAAGPHIVSSAAMCSAGPDPLSAASMYSAGPHALSAAAVYAADDHPAAIARLLLSGCGGRPRQAGFAGKVEILVVSQFDRR